MMASFYAARNATIHDKKSLCIHAFPGPAGSPIGPVNGTAPTIAEPPHYIKGEVLSAGWFGPVKAPWQVMQAPEFTPLDVINAMKQASADMLVQSLAPFLIIAEETSFFGYGWFYVRLCARPTAHTTHARARTLTHTHTLSNVCACAVGVHLRAVVHSSSATSSTRRCDARVLQQRIEKVTCTFGCFRSQHRAGPNVSLCRTIQ
jgi:hypothetical protein